MLSKKEKLIIKRLADKYGKSTNEIEAICHHPFKFAKEKIVEDSDIDTLYFPTINILSFLKFYVKKGRYGWLEKNKEYLKDFYGKEGDSPSKLHRLERFAKYKGKNKEGSEEEGIES